MNFPINDNRPMVQVFIEKLCKEIIIKAIELAKQNKEGEQRKNILLTWLHICFAYMALMAIASASSTKMCILLAYVRNTKYINGIIATVIYWRCRLIAPTCRAINITSDNMMLLFL